MRKLLAAQDVASRVDMGNIGAQLVVDGDAAFRVHDARAIKAKALDIGTTAGGNQEILTVRLCPGIRRDDDSRRLRSDGNRTASKPSDPFALEYALKDRPCVGVVVGQQARRHDRDLAAETLKGLGELHAKRTA